MTTHVIQVEAHPPGRPSGDVGRFDSARTSVMVAVAGSVLAASLLAVAGSFSDHGSGNATAGRAPDPAGAHLLSVPQPAPPPAR